MFYTALYVAVLTLLPPMLPVGERAVAAVGMPLISIAVSLTLGVWMLGRLGAVASVEAGYAVAFVAAAVLVAGWDSGLRLPAALVFAAALGIVQGASFAAVGELNAADADRARAAGAIAQLGNLGTTTGTPVLGALVAALGPWGIAAMALPSCAAGIAAHRAMAARRRRQE